jgi:PIN domain nuclease of toxin-antitoxin system
MRLLLDTHVFLWMIAGDGRLSASARQRISDPANEVFLSVASIWECVVKSQVGKLTLPQPVANYLTIQRTLHQVANLDIDEASVAGIEQLPMLHRDPFDRILIAQALQYGLTLLTADAAVLAYNLPAIEKP